MEGYLKLRINPVVRRLLTRLLAIVPAFIVLLIAGDQMVDKMLIFSQVILSMQLAFAVIPLIHFVSDKQKMGKFAISTVTKVISWVIAAVIIILNLKLFAESISEWMTHTSNVVVHALIILFVILVAIMLLVTIIYPIILKRKAGDISVHENIPKTLDTTAKPFRKIALALDYGDNDKTILQYALQLGNTHASYILIHIVESASARVMGSEAMDYETRKDQDRIEEYALMLREKGHDAHGILGFQKRATEIARIIKQNDCDLLIIGSHGHKGAQDWLFGETINSVRHLIDIPVFIAR
jgi:manganese transport protein